MLPRPRRPSAALIVALLALAVASTGTAVAAKILITSGGQVRAGVLTGRNVRDGSLTGRDVRAGAGLKLRYIATTYSSPASLQASGSAVCPAGYRAIGGGVSGSSTSPGEQVVNATLPLDDPHDRDRIPERWVGFVENRSSRTDLTFEVDAVCAPAARASSNFGRDTRPGARAAPRSAAASTVKDNASRPGR